MKRIVRGLLSPPAVGLVKTALHCRGHLVGVEDRVSVDVSRRPADHLYEGCLASKKSLVVSGHDGDERDLRQVDTLAHEINPDEAVDGIILERL